MSGRMMTERFHRIKAVLFDFDGTLSRPDAIDFLKIKRDLNCPLKRPILEFIETLPTAQQQQSAFSILEQYEAESAAVSVPSTGSEELIRYLIERKIPIGIITRNSHKSIKRALKNFNAVTDSDFACIVSREAPVAPKPSPEAVLLAVEQLQTKVEETLVVGDYIFDIEAGNRAGTWTAWITNHADPPAESPKADFTFSDLTQLQQFIRQRLPCHAGKLPNDLLAECLEDLVFDDPSVLIRPRVGEDTAAVDVRGEETLVIKSDPITFVAENIGYYTVLINANDIATSGAQPRWFMSTLLFPLGTTPMEIRQIMSDMSEVCRTWGIALCGGHTEITDAVIRPVVSGMLIGTVAAGALIKKQNLKPGDQVILTKTAAVEGTAIIAQEFLERLRRGGMSDDDITKCLELRACISILDEARIASESPGVHAMHDVTEGGLATAVAELRQAGGCGIEIQMEEIPIDPRTERICRLLSLNPLGLIGSGSLLIGCDPDHTRNLISRIENSGIQASLIGKVTEKNSSVTAIKRGAPAPWPQFEVDEITRLYENTT